MRRRAAGLNPAGGEKRAHQAGYAGQDVAKAVGKGLADGEDHLKDPTTTTRKRSVPRCGGAGGCRSCACPRPKGARGSRCGG